MDQRIFIMSPDDTGPIGGVKQIYRHVDVLNKFGIKAWVLHRKKGFRCQWFVNRTPTISWSEFQWKDDDILVLPEIFGQRMAKSLRIEKHSTFINRSRYWEEDIAQIRKVIFNQNAYNTFARYGFDPQDLDTPYVDRSVLATIVVSEDSREYLQSVFPHHPIHRIHNAIDSRLFPYQQQKKKQICFMPRKHREEAQEVINIAKFRTGLGDFSIVPIENRNESEVAGIMKESLVFLSFGYPEGFSLPPAEAMSCGCIVIGYHGGGGREYFDSAYSFPIEATDIRTFARTLEKIILSYRDNVALLDKMRLTASHYITENYSQKREEYDIITAWEKILGHIIAPSII